MMHVKNTVVLCLGSCLYLAALAQAQMQPNPLSVPRIIRYSGHADTPQPRTAGATFSIYKEEHGGNALWSEVQNIQIDKDGNYTTLLGSIHPEGMPVDVFNTTEPRWLEIEIDQVKQPRVLVSSVPYALRAADADTLGGLPASAYLRADRASASSSVVELNSSTTAALSPNAITGMQGFLPVFTSSNNDLGNSTIFQPTSTQVTIGGQTPLGALTLIGNVPFSDAPGMALFNQGGGAGASVSLDMYNTIFNSGIPQAKIKAVDDGNYSDHLTFLLKNPGGPSNSVVERMRLTSVGKLGIGTTTPTQMLDVMGVGRFTGGIQFNDGTTQTTAATGGGGITEVKTNSPLSGGGTSGSVSISLTNCSANQILQQNPAGSGWTCANPPSGSGGGISAVSAGTGIATTTLSGTATVSIDTAKVPLLTSPNTFTATQTINTNTTGPAPGVKVLSGGNFTSYALGRGAIESEFGIAGAATNFSSISTPGDSIIRNTTNNLILSALNSSGNIFLTTGAPTDTAKLTVLNNGNVGIGTTSPGSLLQVGSGGSTGKVEILSGDNNFGQLQIGNLANNGEASMAFMSGVTSLGGNPQASAIWLIGQGISQQGSTKFSVTSPTNGVIWTWQNNGEVFSNTGAHLATNGNWGIVSDRNKKENFSPVSTTDILQKINALPLTEWNYKVEGSSVRHIGPMAQDFYSIFGVGDSDTSISPVDPAGIALAGIQALGAKATDLEKQLAAKTDEVRSLQERLARLEAMMQQLAAQPAQ